MAPESAYGSSGRGVIHKGLQGLAEIPSTGELAVYVSCRDISKYIGNLSWKNSIYELSTTLSFETAKTDNAYLKDIIYSPALGDIIRMVTNVEVFRGVVVKIDDGTQYVIESTSHSYKGGWHYNKLELRRQS